MDIGGGLFFEVPQEHDADVVFVLVSNVGSLILERAGFPDATCTVNDVVVADITPAAFFHMEALDVLKEEGELEDSKDGAEEGSSK